VVERFPSAVCVTVPRRERVAQLMGLLQLLLGPQVGGVTARLLAAVCSPKQIILSNSQCCGFGPGAFLTPGSGMGKKSRSGSGMNIPEHFSIA
jgi:hypothetical protein